MRQKIWFITGVSSGLGKSLAAAVIEKGDFVIGSFRNQGQANLFNEAHRERAFGLCMDIKNAGEINEGMETIKRKFGTLDVLVNNAGFGLAGAIEETSMEEAREVFEVNFFGTLRVTQMALPVFRNQRSGHIIQISSHSGFKAFKGFGIYNASKFALEGFSEALAQELAPLNIRLTIVEPGPFRTNFAASSFKEAKTIIADYDETAGAFRKRMKEVNGTQEGDPDKAAKAIIEIAEMDDPPLRLPLGRIAVTSLKEKLESVSRDLNDFKAVAESCVYN